MKFNRGQAFLNTPMKHVTLLGMSGVGKTHLSQLLKQEGWYHFSVDFQIGQHYLRPTIEASITEMVSHLEPIQQGLFSIQSHIKVDDLSPVSHFIGQLGNPERGGIGYPEFMRRQAAHYAAEVSSIKDSVDLINHAKTKDFNSIINDAGGSLCEIEGSGVFEIIAPHTLLLYIESSPEDLDALIERAIAYPKPLYFNTAFLDDRLKEYLTLQDMEYVAQINPSDFSRWIFPKLVEARKTKMDDLCQRYGYKVSSKAIQSVNNSQDFLQLIAETIDTCQ